MHSRKEFSYWFSQPLTHMVEGSRERNDDLIRRLHSVVRPFLLRRLKKVSGSRRLDFFLCLGYVSGYSFLLFRVLCFKFSVLICFPCFPFGLEECQWISCCFSSVLDMFLVVCLFCSASFLYVFFSFLFIFPVSASWLFLSCFCSRFCFVKSVSSSV